MQSSHDLLVLVVAQRRRLAGRADGNQTVAALRDLPFDEFFETLGVHLAVFERRYQRGK